MIWLYIGLAVWLIGIPIVYGLFKDTATDFAGRADSAAAYPVAAFWPVLLPSMGVVALLIFVVERLTIPARWLWEHTGAHLVRVGEWLSRTATERRTGDSEQPQPLRLIRKND